MQILFVHLCHCSQFIFLLYLFEFQESSPVLYVSEQHYTPSFILSCCCTRSAHQTCPLSHSYDHEINLNETFTPKTGKLYLHSTDDKKATKYFLDKNLTSRKICPLNSPQATPFFFIKKKDGGLCPCQDYCYLNEHII